MGRYYNGDIEGKFWFAVQSSDDASFFGGSESEPNHINFYFGKDDLPDIKKGLKECEKELGIYLKKMDKFFDDNEYYTDDKLADCLELPTVDTKTGKNVIKESPETKELLRWYARRILGMKILKSVKETGCCEFEAEL